MMKKREKKKKKNREKLRPHGKLNEQKE